MTGLDILTARGQETVVDAIAAAAIWMQWHPDCVYAPTPTSVPSVVDAVLLREGVVEGVAETKCRYRLTLDDFQSRFGGEWLVTMDKLVKASQVSSLLRVPAYGFLYIVEDRVLLTQQITDIEGQFCVPLRCERTVTQRTVNGGEIVRANAFIDMRSARVWRPRDVEPTEGNPVEKHGCLGSSTKLDT